jgi:hypothetical protein
MPEDWAEPPDFRVRLRSRIGALPHRNWRFDARVYFILSVADSLGEENMTSMIAILLGLWLGSNVVLVALRLYVTADRAPHAKRDFAGYPRLVD